MATIFLKGNFVIYIWKYIMYFTDNGFYMSYSESIIVMEEKEK